MERTYTIMDHETGEVVHLHGQKFSLNFYENEANNLKGSVQQRLMGLIIHCTVIEQDGGMQTIDLSSYRREQIRKALGVSESGIRKAISALVKRGYIRKVKRSVYELNPFFNVKGSFQEALILRASYLARTADGGEQTTEQII